MHFTVKAAAPFAGPLLATVLGAGAKSQEMLLTRGAGQGLSPPPLQGGRADNAAHECAGDAAGPFLARYWALAPCNEPASMDREPDFKACTLAPDLSTFGDFLPSGIGEGCFAARWTASVTLDAGEYVFRSSSSAGHALSVDGQTLVSEWRGGRLTRESRARVGFGAHVIEYEARKEGRGAASAQLTWQRLTGAEHALSAVAVPGSCVIEVGVQYTGHVLAHSEVGSPAACCSLCDQKRGCASWSMVTGTTHRDQGRCYLRGAYRTALGWQKHGGPF